MYRTYEPQASTSLLDAILDSPLLFALSVAAASLLLFLVIAMIAAFFDKSTDPYAELSEKSLAARAAIATSLLSACLPKQFTGREKPARVSYSIDPSGHCMVDLRTAGGAPMTLPGELLSIVRRIISPQVGKGTCAVFADKDATSIRHHLGEHDRDAVSLDTLDARFEPLACEGSALAERRDESARSSQRTNTAIIAANTATITSINS